MEDLTLTAPEDPISLSAEQAPPALRPEDRVQRILQAHYALQEKSPGVDQLGEIFQQGHEQRLREQLAIQQGLDNRKAKLDIIRRAVEQKGSPLTDQEQADIQNLLSAPNPIRPDTILENLWANNFVRENMTAPGNDTAKRGLLSSPEYAFSMAGYQHTYISKRQELQTLQQEANARYDQLSWNPLAEGPSKTGAWAQSFVPFLQNYQLHNVLVPEGGILPGNNMSTQVDAAYSLPEESFLPVVRAHFEDLWQKNPHAAMAFLDALSQRTTSDQFLENAFGITEAATAIPGGWLARGAKSLIWGTKRAAEVAAGGVAPLTAQAAKSMENITLSPELVKALEAGKNIQLRMGEDINRTVSIPRGMTIQEFEKARQGLGLPPAEEPVAPASPVNPGGVKAAQEGIGSVGGEVYPIPNTGRAADVREIDRIREGLGLIGRDITEDEKATIQSNFRAFLSTGVKSLRTAPQASTEVDAQEALSTLGRIEDAAQVGAVQDLEGLFKKVDPHNELNTLSKEVPSLVRPNIFYENSAVLSGEAKRRVIEWTTGTSSKFWQALMGDRVPRLDRPDLLLAMDQARKTAAREFNALEDAHITTLPDWAYSPASNTHYIYHVLGKRDATGFESAELATNTALLDYKLVPGDFIVKQQGQSYFLYIPRPVNELDPLVKQSPITTLNTAPRSTYFWWLTALRSSADSTSKFQQAAKIIATHAPQELKAMLIDTMNEIKLPRLERQRMATLLHQNRLEYNPAKKGPGKWYDTASELEQAYLDRWGTLPSEDFLKAYDTFTKVSDFDGMIRELGWYSTKSRWGALNFTFRLSDEQGKQVSSAPFEGRRVDALPDDPRVRTILKVNEDGSRELLSSKDIKNTKALRDDFEEKQKAGWDLIQLFSPTKKPLAESTNVSKDIHYVFTNSATSKHMNWGDNIEWRPGGHHVYLYPHYVKQPILGTDNFGNLVYYGDRTFMSGGSSAAEAKAWVQKYDTARRIMNTGDDRALDTYLRGNLPETVDSFKAHFAQTEAEAQSTQKLDKNLPIVYTYSGQTSFESNPELAGVMEKHFNAQGQGFRDYIVDPGNPEAALNKKFLSERADVILQRPYARVGTDGNPILVKDNAPMLDPYISLNRAMGQAIRSRYMDDMKVLAAESFIKEFGKYVPNKSMEELQQNPLYYIYHLDPQHLQGPERAAFRAQQRNLQAFLGMSSEIGRDMNYVEQKMMDWAYGRLGSGFVDKIQDPTTTAGAFMQRLALPAIRDPGRFLRSAAFHMKLGLFNPVQFFVQAQTLSNVIGIAGPVAAYKGMAAATLARFARYTDDPAIIDRLARISTKFGWTEDQFKEALIHWKQSGVSRVAGETAWRDDFLDPKIYMSGVQKFLDKGTVFFQEGERIPRDTAFFTAFHEYRLANPNTLIDNIEKGQILRRFDNLTANMTRASNAAFQSGIFSVPAQFLTFNTRMMDQFLGKRLTGLEKARTLLTFAGMYGIPVAASVPLGFAIPEEWTGGIPTNYEDIRTKLLENGVNLNEGWIKAAHEGLISYALGLAGVDMNFGQRMGPGANTILRDVWNGKKGVFELAAGPTGGILDSFLKNNYPLWAYARNMWTGDKFDLTPEDAVNAFSDMSTASQATKLYYAYNYAKYYARSGAYVGDVTPWQGFVMSITGMQPMEFEDMFLKQASISKQKESQKDLMHAMEKEYLAAAQAADKGDIESMNNHFKRATALGKGADLRDEQFMQAWTASAKGNEPLFDRVNRAFKKYAPKSELPARNPELYGGQ